MDLRFAAFLLVFSCAFAQDAPKLRLPGEVRPLHYDLELQLVPAREAYSGTVKIDVEVLKPAATVWLHASALKIAVASVGGQPARVTQSGDFLGLAPEAPLKPGKTRIALEFSGAFNKNDVEGLFRQVEAGEPYLFTQFEPTSARRAFPCFDEPSFKTPWRLTLHVPQDSKAFANTPVVSEKPEAEGLKTVMFAESKPLPSYLVAIAVGRFDVTAAGKAGRKGIPVRTIVLKGRAPETAFVNSVTPKIVATLEDFFGLPYPYEKLDQITIPITVGFGAMENAGLVTYQQTLLLAKPAEVTPRQQRATAGVVAHELAHQWFGNMVTPAWWDDIWLNEAFATWMANKVVDRLYPEWQTAVSAAERKADVMAQDALLSARRVRQPIEQPGDIGSAFDGITYQKGSALIRMFENYLGEERFLRGVRAYIRKYAWGNATAGDFLASVSGAAGRNIAPAFSKFLDRGGVPLVTVELKCDGAPRVAFSQQRSLPVGSKGSRDEYWSVPVCFRYEAGGKVSSQCVMLSDPKEEVALRSAAGCPAWLTANDEAAGYYQVLYRGDLTAKLLANADKLALNEKVDLVRNASALLKSGRMPPQEAFLLAKQFGNAQDPELVQASIQLVRSVEKAIPPELRSPWFGMIREFFGEKAREIGWRAGPSEPANVALLRPTLMGLVGWAGDPAVVSEARKLADAWLADRTTLPGEVAGAALGVAASHGNLDFYNKLIAALKQTKTFRERGIIIHALGNFRDPAIARRALDLMLSGEVDIRELSGLFALFQDDPATARATWDFVVSNYDRLVPRLPSRLGTAGASILPVAGLGFCDTAGYQTVAGFFGERIKGVTGGDRTLATVLEAIQLCDALRKTQSAAFAEYLRQFRAE